MALGPFHRLLVLALALTVALMLLAVAWGPGACYCIGSPPGLWASKYRLVIADPDEADAGVVEALRSSGAAVLAYVNIGYAEEWRAYWPEALAAGIVHGETEYEGEYFVEYWRPEWRAIMEKVVDEALSRGFSGVYLDNIDAYMVLGEAGPPPWAAGVDLRGEMLRLVSDIAGYARSRGAVLVYGNLGGAAVDLRGGLELEGSLDGVLREEVLYRLSGGCSVEPTEPGEASRVYRALAAARASGMDVVVVEFVDYPWQAARALAAHSMAGFRVVLQDACDPGYTRPPLDPRDPLQLILLLLDDLG